MNLYSSESNAPKFNKNNVLKLKKNNRIKLKKNNVIKSKKNNRIKLKTNNVIKSKENNRIKLKTNNVVNLEKNNASILKKINSFPLQKLGVFPWDLPAASVSPPIRCNITPCCISVCVQYITRYIQRSNCQYANYAAQMARNSSSIAIYCNIYESQGNVLDGQLTKAAAMLQRPNRFAKSTSLGFHFIKFRELTSEEH